MLQSLFRTSPITIISTNQCLQYSISIIDLQHYYKYEYRFSHGPGVDIFDVLICFTILLLLSSSIKAGKNVS